MPALFVASEKGGILMKLTDELYESVKDIWEGYHSHPFIQEMRAGTLPIEKFRYYMIQDYIYLYEYAKVFALGVVKSKDHDMMRMFSGMVESTLNDEMDTHKSYMKRLGITEEEVAQTHVALSNVSYTNYMMTEAYQGGILEILVTILSCAWSYQLIGEEMAKEPRMTEHKLFGEWVRSYSSEEYRKMNDNLLLLVNQLGEGISQKEKDNLIDIFTRCSLYEGMFWDMAYRMEE